MDFGSVMGLLGGAANAYGGADPDEELRRLRAEMAARDAASGQAAGRSAGAASQMAEQMARQTRPYSYEYTPKAQAAGQPAGQQFGVMTDDLKKTPAGRSVVKKDPKTGMEAVDTDRLTMQNTAAIGQVVRKQDSEREQRASSVKELWSAKQEQDYQRAIQDLERRLAELRQL